MAIFSSSSIISVTPFNRRHVNFNRRVKYEFDRLHPKVVLRELIRIGGFRDGGYLIPDLDFMLDGLISPGVGQSFSFETELMGNGKKAVLIDGTVEKPANLPENMIFI